MNRSDDINVNDTITRGEDFSASVESVDTKGAFIDFPELNTIGSYKLLEPEVNKRSCYIGTLDEGYGKLEEVVNKSDNKDASDKNEDGEVFTATPLEDFEIISEVIDNNDSLENRLSLISDQLGQNSESSIFKPFEFKTYSENDSDSESDKLFDFLSDSSGDESYLSILSPEATKHYITVAGNLPHFDILDVSTKVEQKFKAPLNPLVSKRNPTATVTHLPEPSLVETHLETNSDLSDSQETGQHTKIVPSVETSTSQFCSTNVQSALLNKIVSRDDAGAGARNPLELNFIDFPIPVPSKRRKSASESNFSTKHKEDTEYNTKSKIKLHERDIAADLDNFESEVGKAFEESISEGSVLPLLKQELQCKIQVKRLSRGQSELFLEQEEPKTYELRPEEIEKKNMRLEQNRRSAERARKKARSREKVLLKTIKREMSENARLQGEIDSLQRIRVRLKAIHDQHMKYCKRK